ncbi:M20/M25/M40 family peptidase [Enterococcus faecium DO]|uniref:M20/M25/M40 family peptidase n=1 Tax=Enterococcus faecium (strain ATCC BAA-472 / TX0016 / DO) TaxID=333849 RepID=I3U3U9_ENTFD|nr:M20/M25/M40 family peptidase [Enterococcus faecium DO]
MKKEEKIAILQEIIRIKSVNGNEGEVAAYLNKLLAKHDITGEIVSYRDGRDNLIARYQKGQSGKVLGLSGHMDVVAAGDESSWTYAPFAAEIHGNRYVRTWCYRYEEWLGSNGDCHDRTERVRKTI